MTQSDPTWLDKSFAPNARGTTGAAFTMPAVNASVAVRVDLTDWMVVGQGVYIVGAGSMTVASIESSKACHLTNTGAVGNAAPTTTIVSGSALTSSGNPGADGAGVPQRTLDGSGGVVPGNALTSATSGSLIKKAVGRLARSLGISSTTTSAGAKPTTVTSGLAAAADVPTVGTNVALGTHVVRDPATGNPKRVLQFTPADDYLGEADSSGNLMLLPPPVRQPGIRVQASDPKYGMIGDGSTDNSPGLCACIAEAFLIAQLVGAPDALCSVQFDAGDYVFNSPVTVGVYDATNGYQCGIVLRGSHSARVSGTGRSTQFRTNYGAPPQGAAANVAASTSSPGGNVSVITGLSGAVSSWVGKKFYRPPISSTNAGPNVGTFAIVAVNSSSSITVSAPLMQLEAGVPWMILDDFLSIQSRDCRIEDISFGTYGTTNVVASAIQFTKPPWRGTLSAVTPSNGGDPAVTISGVPFLPLTTQTCIIKIIGGGVVGVATFQYSINNGSTWSGTRTTAATYILGKDSGDPYGGITGSNAAGIGITAAFAAGTYVANHTYTFTATSNVPGAVTRNGCERVYIDQTGGSSYYVDAVTIADRIGVLGSLAPDPQNCDFHRFVDCGFQRFAHAGIRVNNATGQSKRHTVFDCLFNSGLYGIRLLSGSFTSITNSFGNLTYVVAVTTPTDTLEFYSTDAEGNARFLVSEGGADGSYCVSFFGGRIDCSTIVADQTARLGSSDGYIIKWQNMPGPLNMTGVDFCDSYVPTFAIYHSAPGSHPARGTFIGCNFPNSPRASIIAGTGPRRHLFFGCRGIDSNGNTASISDGALESGSPTDLHEIGALSSVTLSALPTRASNLIAVATIGGANTSKAIVFPIAEPDDDYTVTLSPGIFAGTPSGTALRASYSAKSKTGLTVNLEGAPGAGNVVQVYAHIIQGMWTPHRALASGTALRWWRADQGFNGGTGAWTDLVASLVASSVGGSIPTLATNTANGMPSIRFGGNAALQATWSPQAQPLTRFIVWKLDSTAGLQFPFDGIDASANRVFMHSLAGGALSLSAGHDNAVTVTPDQTNLHTYALVLNGVNGASYIDGASVLPTVDYGTNGTNGITIGAAETLGLNMTGNVCEIIDYAGVLSVADVAIVSQYLRDLWGTP